MRAEPATSTRAALEQVQAAAAQGDPYRVVLVEQSMPEEEIAAFAAQVRAVGEQNAKLILMVSTSAPRIVRIPEFDATVPRPVRAKHLVDVVRRLLTPAPSSTLALEAAVRESAASPRREGETSFFDCRVLLVEDNQVNQRVGSALLGKLGAWVAVASDGRQAMDLARTNLPFDIIFMDCQMPGIDGYETTRLIRKAEGGARRTPIVALTAAAMESDRRRCLEAGMDDFLTKPVDLEGLRGMLDKWAHPATASPPAPAAADASGSTPAL
jgi:CheY-like chemotaxis protein